MTVSRAPHPAPLDPPSTPEPAVYYTPPPIPAADRSALHAALLRLAGRIPDDGLAMMHASLADGDPRTVLAMLTAVAGTGRIALTAGERHALAGLCDSYQVAPGPLDAAPPADRVPMPPYLFESDPLLLDYRLIVFDAAVAMGAPVVPGLRALWRSLRRPSGGGRAPDDRAGPRCPIYLGEADPGADVVEITAEIQYRIVEAGDIRPRVEIFEAGAELAPYHEAALGAGLLFWTSEPRQPLKLARVFDGRHPQRGPYFADDHAVLDGEARERVLAYLRAGEQVLATHALLPDVMAPTRSAGVPAGFRSDGVWVWNEAAAYYLDQHRLAPEPDLVTHVLARDGLPESLDRLAYHLAIASIAPPIEVEPEAATQAEVASAATQVAVAPAAVAEATAQEPAWPAR